jgi:uncharacterized membrane protein (DUF4010 family)
MTALGVGLLIGAERERRKRQQPAASEAGIRTFALAALAGAVSLLAGGPVLLAVTLGAAGLLVALGYWRTRDDRDPGMTTEIALLFTILLGALAMSEPGLAAGLAAVAAILLAARTPLHRFVDQVLTADEVRDALVLAGATLVVLPLLPDRPMGPYLALNPHSIWIIVLLVLAISALGHIAVRVLGARFGLPLAGLSSGFISSAATIGAMGGRAKAAPAILPAAVAGAVLSTVATIVQMAILVAATSPPVLRALAPALICAGLAAAAYGAAFTLRALRQPAQDGYDPGSAFSLPSALIFAATVSVILVLSAAFSQQFGARGVIAAAAVAGLADTHAAAISVASLAFSGRISADQAVLPILAGLTTNTLTKIVFASVGGGRAFALRVIPGLILVAAAAWAGSLI